MIRPLLKRLCEEDRGTALIESAIVLPVFLVLVGGVYEFGYFFYQQQLMTTGVRDAARYLALTPNPNSVFYQSDAARLAVYGVSKTDIQPRVPGWSPGDVSITVTAIDNSSNAFCSGCAVEIINVSSSQSDASLGFLGLLGLRSPVISVSHQERWIGGAAMEGNR